LGGLLTNSLQSWFGKKTLSKWRGVGVRSKPFDCYKLMNTKDIDKNFIKQVTDNQKIIHKISHVYCSNAEDRQDLFQEVLLNAWRSYSSFANLSKFSTWLYKVALNTALMYQRSHRKQEQITWLDLQQLQQKAIETDTSNEQIQRLYQAIAHLDEHEKSIVILYLDELSYKEIAEIVGITENNVGVKLNRIKQKLKQLLHN
jgi:RNA polymerase sigma-70 factor (ECF subfamily)